MPSKRARNPSRAVSTPSAATGSIPPQFFVIDSFHFINDRSLFTTFTPVSKVFRSAFGTVVAIEVHGTVPLYFMAFGQLHGFTAACAYAPSIPNHLYSSISSTQQGLNFYYPHAPLDFSFLVNIGRRGRRSPSTFF